MVIKKKEVVQFTKGILDKIKEDCFTEFIPASYVDDDGIHQPKIDLYSVVNGEFTGHMFLKSERFIRKDKWVIHNDGLLKPVGCSSSITKNMKYEGTVKRYKKVKYSGNEPFELCCLYSKMEAEVFHNDASTNIWVIDNYAGILDGDVNMKYIVELYSGKERKKMFDVWEKYNKQA
jgi:hypothetical protein